MLSKHAQCTSFCCACLQSQASYHFDAIVIVNRRIRAYHYPSQSHNKKNRNGTRIAQTDAVDNCEIYRPSTNAGGEDCFYWFVGLLILIWTRASNKSNEHLIWINERIAHEMRRLPLRQICEPRRGRGRGTLLSDLSSMNWLVLKSGRAFSWLEPKPERPNGRCDTIFFILVWIWLMLTECLLNQRD